MVLPHSTVIGKYSVTGPDFRRAVCTYFSRVVETEADSLMQMARWFYFEKDTRIITRIWLTAIAQIQSFKFLNAAFDKDLREDLYKYQGVTTEAEYGLLILQTLSVYPYVADQKNKSQSEVDGDGHSGANLPDF